ncbi:hypothetical protein Syun_021245 [Stephania yunnanensis]|uniref:Protein POLAR LOCALIZATION DURING ASYMMETRIC DIVISION AND REDISTRIBUTION n=1 Tax=Stephania yunnanensis TaxID=152371 RepID=A0AAP0IFF8_9MAGN
MDFWAMAAAAGYVTKHWQRVAKEEGLQGRGRVSGGSASLPLSAPISESVRRPFGEEMGSLGDAEMPSTSGFDGELLLDDERGEDCENEGVVERNVEEGHRFRRELVEFSAKEMGFGCGRLIRRRRGFGRGVKPLNSLESCLVSQLYREHVEMEELVFSSLPSRSALAVRPLLVSDGNRIISRSSSSLCGVQSEGGESKWSSSFPVENECNLEEESLLGSVSMQLPKKPKQKRAKRQHEKSSHLNTVFLDKQGSPDGMFFFCIGVTVGVISTILANKREVDKLNELLKQTNSFVQDLQEELEMKDSLTVKELTNESYDSHGTNDHSLHSQAPNVFASSLELDKISSNDIKILEDKNLNVNSDPMSKIEAELEAELEKMELNMNSSSFYGQFSDHVERERCNISSYADGSWDGFDQDFAVDIVQGELRADKVNGLVIDSVEDGTGASTDQQKNVNYAVSPRELSMRLHEVLQSRLEERINELETALQNSQKRNTFMESYQINSWKDYSNSEKENLTQESCRMGEADNCMTCAFCLNLCEGALDAYNEAYDEFDKQNVKEGDDSSRMTYTINQAHIEKLRPFDHDIICDRNGVEQNGSLRHLEKLQERDSHTLIDSKIPTWEERVSSSQESYEVSANNDETEDDDQEEEMAQLLKQVLEKSKQGSPLVLNAQRALLSMD